MFFTIPTFGNVAAYAADK